MVKRKTKAKRGKSAAQKKHQQRFRKAIKEASRMHKKKGNKKSWAACKKAAFKKIKK